MVARRGRVAPIVVINKKGVDVAHLWVSAHMATGCPRGQNRNSTKTMQLRLEETETAAQGSE